MLNSRIGGSIDFYNREINGLLYDYTVPSPPNLYTSTRANVGVMSNQGMEILLNIVPVRRKEVYDFIISEITGNIPALSEQTGGEYYGRFNKWAAATLLAKMYLNAQVFSDGAYTEWDKCIAACDEVIGSGRYALEADQRLVFITNNENSK
jgi:hypothetical protein